MGFFNRARFAAKAAQFAFNNLSRLEKVGENIFYPFGFTGAADFWTADVNQWLNDYIQVPEVNAIINWKARAFSNMKLDVVNAKTGEPAPNSLPAARLIRRPNYFQSQKEFIRQSRLFYYIFGNEIIYASRPLAWSVKSATGLFTLPYNLLDIQVKGGKKFIFNEQMPDVVMIFNFGGLNITIPYNECFHLNDNNVQLSDTDFITGMSRLASLQAPIKNLRASYEARNVMIENRGALGILTNDGSDAGGAIPLDPDDKKDLQEQFRKYGLTKKQYQFILTSLSLKWQQIAIDTDKLKLFDEATEDQRKLIDGYGLRQEIFAKQKGSTFENQLQAERAIYQDTIIPEAEEWTIGLTQFLGLEGSAWKVSGTFDHLAVFQENLKEYSTGLRLLVMGLNEALAIGAIDLAQYRRKLEEFGIEGPFPTNNEPLQLTP